MNNKIRLTAIIGSLLLAPSLLAQPLTVENARAKPTFAMAKMGAAYGVLSNTTDNPVEITGMQISPEIAASVELHETYLKGDMAGMRQLPFPVEIAAGEQLELLPRGKHIMLIGLKKPLEAGMHFDVLLTTSTGEELVMPVVVSDEKRDGGHEKQPHHHHH